VSPVATGFQTHQNPANNQTNEQRDSMATRSLEPIVTNVYSGLGSISTESTVPCASLSTPPAGVCFTPRAVRSGASDAIVYSPVPPAGGPRTIHVYAAAPQPALSSALQLGTSLVSVRPSVLRPLAPPWQRVLAPTAAADDIPPSHVGDLAIVPSAGIVDAVSVLLHADGDVAAPLLPVHHSIATLLAAHLEGAVLLVGAVISPRLPYGTSQQSWIVKR